MSTVNSEGAAIEIELQRRIQAARRLRSLPSKQGNDDDAMVKQTSLFEQLIDAELGNQLGLDEALSRPSGDSQGGTSMDDALLLKANAGDSSPSRRSTRKPRGSVDVAASNGDANTEGATASAAMAMALTAGSALMPEIY